MKLFAPVFISSFLFSIMLFGNNVNATAVNFTLRTNSCDVGETCIFSLFDSTNSHAGSCGEYSWNVCAVNINSVNIRNFTCNAGEGGIISLYNTSNAHAETYNFGNYNYSYCVSPRVSCSYGSSASSLGEAAVVSMFNQTNSHMAESSYYANKIYCREVVNPTITIVSPANKSYSSLTFDANITLDEEGNVSLYSFDGAANATMTKNGNTAFGARITSTKGPHSIKFYANDTSGNMAASDTVFFTLGSSIIVVSGTIQDSLTGRRVEGNVTLLVKETGQSAANYTTGGSFISHVPSQVQNFESDLVTLGIFINTTDERVGYSVVEINSGGNVLSSPGCASKRWHFNGTANDPGTGDRITVGTVGVNVRNSVGNIFSNSTAFDTGVWDIYLTPCLVPGELSTFEFTISNDTKRGYFSIRQVAK